MHGNSVDNDKEIPGRAVSVVDYMLGRNSCRVQRFSGWAVDWDSRLFAPLYTVGTCVENNIKCFLTCGQGYRCY